MPDTVVDTGNLRVRQYWPLPGRAPILEGEINAHYNRALSDPGKAEVVGSSGRRGVDDEEDFWRKGDSLV